MKTQTIKQLANQVKIKSVYVDSNPMVSDDFSLHADNWRVTLFFENRRMTTYFTKGKGHYGAQPTADEVLYCLVSDAVSIECACSAQDWIAEMGYEDYNSGIRVYENVERLTHKLEKLTGINSAEMIDLLNASIEADEF